MSKLVEGLRSSPSPEKVTNQKASETEGTTMRLEGKHGEIVLGDFSPKVSTDKIENLQLDPLDIREFTIYTDFPVNFPKTARACGRTVSNCPAPTPPRKPKPQSRKGCK